jgi:protein-disulfide isomerase
VQTSPRHHLVAWKGIPWLGGSLLLLLSVVAIGLFTGAAASEQSKVPPASADDISYGPADAPLTVIEYSDFQCPFCAQYAVWLRSLHERYGDRVKFVYRFYPLANHQWATLSARSAYAAYMQGKFWEMHDLLFENQEQWAESDDPRPYLDAYAQSLGLDLDKFHADADAQSTLDVIKRQAAGGKRGGVTHTPWLVVGDKVVLPRSLEELDKIIQEAL